VALTVLIVDDDTDMRLYLRSCLRGMGPRIGRVLEAADGLEALAVVQTGFVDLVICDVVMPRLGGYGLSRAIRDDPELRRLRVLLVSGEAINATSVAPDGFLPKPFNAGQLETALVELFPHLKLEAR
jgi:CheY-like chemotaxis protein